MNHDQLLLEVTQFRTAIEAARDEESLYQKKLAILLYFDGKNDNTAL